MKKYLIVMLATLSLALVSSSSFADCWCSCYSCDGYYRSSYDYGYYTAYPGYYDYDGFVVGVFLP